MALIMNEKKIGRIIKCWNTQTILNLYFFNICNRLYESLYNNTQSQYCVMWSITKRMFKMYIKPNNFILRPWSFWNGLVLISEPFYQYLHHIISIICLIRWVKHQIITLSLWFISITSFLSPIWMIKTLASYIICFGSFDKFCIW